MVLSVASLEGGTTNVSHTAQPGQPYVQDPEGNPLTAGNEVRVGYFPPGFDVAGQADDLQALNDAWVSYQSDDESRLIRTLSGQQGRFTSTHSREAGTFPGKKIYLWIFKTNDNNIPTPDLGNVEAFGLYSATGWTFPTNATPPANSITVTTSQVTEAYFGSFDSSALQLMGVPATGLTYNAWKNATFTGETPLDLQDPLDDPDGDDLTNSLEFLLGTAPEDFSDIPITTTITGDVATLTYRRVTSIPAEIDQVEVSEDLALWSIDSSITISTQPLDETHSLVTVTIPLAGRDRCFAKIVVNVNGS